jgi:RimJ/RimL family protein N-acetyltransferase
MALRLRPVRLGDLDTLERWWADPEAQGPHNWFGFPPDSQLRRRFEQDGLLGEDRGNLLVELEDGTLVGDVSYYAVYHGPNPGSRPSTSVSPCCRVERLEASTDVGNTAEQRALERAGFTREGTLRHAQFRDGEFHDLVLYSRLRDDRPSQG